MAKIDKLEIKNLKRIKAVSLDNLGNFVLIGGNNNQGKTSLLDGIWFTLKGGKVIQNTPIRKGAKEGSCVLEWKGFKVTRTFTAKGETEFTTKLKVEINGTEIKGAQGVLDKFISDFTFDPLAFSLLGETAAGRKKQRDTLLSLVDISINLDEIAAKKERLYNERADVNKNVNIYKTNLGVITLPDNPENYQELIDVVQVAQELQVANEQRLDLVNKKNSLNVIIEDEKGVLEEIKGLEEKLKRLATTGEKLDKEIKETPEPALAELQAKLDGANEFNDKVNAVKHHAGLSKKHNDAKADSDKLTQLMKDLETSKVDALSKAEFPVEGLSVDENGVTYNDLPFEQASGSQKLKVSVAMAAALIPEGGLDLIRIKDASLLDDNNLDELGKMADELGCQFFVEVVGVRGNVSVVMEDGTGVVPKKK